MAIMEAGASITSQEFTYVVVDFHHIQFYFSDNCRELSGTF